MVTVCVNILAIRLQGVKMDTAKKEAIRAGVIAKLKRDGRYTGEFIRADKVCSNPNCNAVFKPYKTSQSYCSISCWRKPLTKEEKIKANTARVTKYRRNLKIKAVAYLGGSCVSCGYNKSVLAMDFHHRDPTKKDFAISVTGATRSWERVKIELDKCDLLCANCHREIHGETMPLPVVRIHPSQPYIIGVVNG